MRGTRENQFGRRALAALALAATCLGPAGLAAAQGSFGISPQAPNGSLPDGATGPGATLVGRPYPALTDSPRGFTNFNVEVVRGFVVRPLGRTGSDAVLETFALNAYESTVVRFVGARERGRWRTVNNPVSIALFEGDLLVVGQGNHALARHDARTGELLDLLMLPSEPADIAVDGDHGEAWISCMGADAVVQVDLGERLRAVKVWSWDEGLRLKRPRFLHLDRGGPEPEDNVLYVAPLVSGNNTLTLPAGGGSIGGVVDGTTLPGGGLPDEDLFRIARGAAQAEPVVRGAGSLILAHGRNPFDGRYHLLTVGHRNFDPSALSEPLLRGTFATHTLSVLEPATLAAAGGPGAPPPDFQVDLDDHDPAPGAQYSPERSLSFPYALAFEPGTGRLAVASSTAPLVALLDADGARVDELSLEGPRGSLGLVPRTLHFDARGRLHVYCQETANILVFDLKDPETPSGGRAPVAVLELGNDPTPEPVRRGRRTWYDARPSLDGRTSCNSCHVQGGADGLAWFLANDPVDAKDVMVTQTLFGIEDSFPYHWRGERDMEAFNGAFSGLLGHGADLDEDGLEDFVEFVFSLSAPANPLQVGPPRIDAEGRIEQDLDRMVKDELVPFALGAGLTPKGPYGPFEYGSATRGLSVYTDEVSFNQRSCVECHSLPTGTSGDVLADNTVTEVSSAATLKISHLDTQLALKHQPVVQLQDPSGKPIFRNLLGFGAGHRGDKVNLLDFNLRFLGNISPRDVLDVTAFIHLFDHGLAPAAHFAAVLDGDSPADTLARIDRWLIRQARLGWLDVVALGHHPVGGRRVPVSWLYDPALDAFVADRQGLAPRELKDFDGPHLRTTFLGAPPGNGFRLGLDFDADGLTNGLERAAGTDPWRPDTDGDGWLDGHELAHGDDPLVPTRRSSDARPPALVEGSLRVDFVNAVSAKLRFETDEPCVWRIDLSAPGAAPVTEDRASFDTVHTAVIQRLSPSTTGSSVPVEVRNTYTGQLVLTDRAGNVSQPVALPPLTTRTMVHDGGLDSLVVGDLELAQEVRTASTYSALATVRADFKEQGPPAVPAAGYIVVGQVLEQAPNGKDWSIVPLTRLQHDAPATDFKYGGVFYGQAPGLRPGPFLIPLPADPNGEVAVRFTVTGLAPAQPVMFNVITVFEPPGSWIPTAPAVPAKFGLGAYQLPATPAALRRAVSSL